MDRQETITDIIAEKRRRADEIERDCAEKMRRGEMVSDQYARELVADIRGEADRLDRARMKMEIEIANLRKENAKLREALVTIQNCDISKEEDCYTLYRTCNAALTNTSNQNTQEDRQ